MELLLVYFYKRVKDKTVELNCNGISYINLLFLLWAAGELLGFLIAYKLVPSWFFRYLIGSSCGILVGWLVYRKTMSLEQRSPDYFDLRQSKTNPGLQPIFNQNEIKQPEKKPEIWPEQKPESLSEYKPEVKVRPELWTENKPEVKVRPEYKPETDVGFRTPVSTTVPTAVPKDVEKSVPTAVPKDVEKSVPTTVPKDVEKSVPTTVPKDVEKSVPTIVPKIVEKSVPTTVAESVTATNRNIFHFPYSELLSINELLIGVYGVQTVKDLSISECQWFGTFKAKYENQEIKAALMVLENAICEDHANGLIWLMFGVLYKDAYHDADKALQFCLTGAKRCNSYKIALLTEAAELLLIGKKDIGNAFKFFSLAIVAITDVSKAWGNSNVDGCIAQERAFHFIRVLLTAFDFKDYRLYLERNIQFTTGMDQALIETVLEICAGSPFRTEIEEQISRMFPLIIEKVQAVG